MKAHQANLVNALVLIIIGAWGAYATNLNSMTALIPVVGGVILLICNKGVKAENKMIGHAAVLITVILIIGLIRPFTSALKDGDNLGSFRTGLMILTGFYATIAFVKSFRDARMARESGA